MWKKLFAIFVLIIALISDSESAAISTTPLETTTGEPTVDTTPIIPVESIDYVLPDETDESRRQSFMYTTERPLIRYWNNFVRSVRLPIPSISWNMTNPLANLFSVGQPNIIESPVTSNYYPTPSSIRRRKNPSKRKRTNYSPNRIRQRARPKVNYDTYQPIYQPQSYLYQPYQQQVNNALYYYDPNSKQYYQMQHVQPQYVLNRPQYVQHSSLNGFNYFVNNYDDTSEEEQYEEPNLSSGIAHYGSNLDIDENNGSPEHNDATENDVDTDDVYNLDVSNLSSHHRLVEDDPDVAIVPELKDDDFDEARKASEHAKLEKTEETLRNAIGAYMMDDEASRKRQRNTVKKHIAKEKSNSRKFSQFYILRAW